MTIKYEPSKLIKKQKIREKAKKVVNSNGTVNRVAVKSLTEFDVLPKKALEQVALTVIKQQKAGGKPVSDELLASRVQSAALYHQTRQIQKAYRGERYRWLKSTAKEKRPEHVKNYGKIFTVGVGDKNGDDPGDLYGCQCGMELLVDDTPAEFNDRLEGSL